MFAVLRVLATVGGCSGCWGYLGRPAGWRVPDSHLGHPPSQKFWQAAAACDGVQQHPRWEEYIKTDCSCFQLPPNLCTLLIRHLWQPCSPVIGETSQGAVVMKAFRQWVFPQAFQGVSLRGRKVEVGVKVMDGSTIRRSMWQHAAKTTTCSSLEGFAPPHGQVA